MEIIGRIKTVLPLQQGTSQRGPWSKATVIIEFMSGQYPKILALDNMSKAAEFAALPVGAEFTFWFEPSSREYQGKYYTQCDCFNWQPVGQQAYQAPTPGYPAPPQGYAPAPQPGYAPQPAPAPGYPQPPQGYAPQPQAQPQGGYPADGDMPY